MAERDPNVPRPPERGPATRPPGDPRAAEGPHGAGPEVGGRPPAAGRPGTAELRPGAEAAIWISVVNAIAGVWLVLSPWIVGYEEADPAWNPVAFGTLLTIIALTRALGAFRIAWLGYVNAAIGAWLFASAFWLSDSTEAAWNVVIVGAIVFILGLWSGGLSQRRRG